MIDDESMGVWRPAEEPPLVFEDRIPQMMLVRMQEAGLADRNPDPVIMSSLFWDDSLLREVSAYIDMQCTADAGSSVTWWTQRKKVVVEPQVQPGYEETLPA
jgi:hypothetical protein